MWSHDVVSTSIGLASDLKIGQYLKIPPRVMFLTQIWGTLLGALVNYIVMVSVVDAQREILLEPKGTNIWRCVHVTLNHPHDAHQYIIAVVNMSRA